MRVVPRRNGQGKGCGPWSVVGRSSGRRVWRNDGGGAVGRVVLRSRGFWEGVFGRWDSDSGGLISGDFTALGGK